MQNLNKSVLAAFKFKLAAAEDRSRAPGRRATFGPAATQRIAGPPARADNRHHWQSGTVTRWPGAATPGPAAERRRADSENRRLGLGPRIPGPSQSVSLSPALARICAAPGGSVGTVTDEPEVPFLQPLRLSVSGRVRGPTPGRRQDPGAALAFRAVRLGVSQ
jgi:hypothetical protein